MRVGLLMAALLCFASSEARPAIQMHDASYTAVLRNNTLRMFPIAVDSVGTVYGVQNTNLSARLQRVLPDGSAASFGSTNEVVGTAADMEFGFGGDLFANAGFQGGFSDGVVRIDRNTGIGSMFWTSPQDQAFADGGLVFDAAHSTLYSMSLPSASLFAINAAGNATVVMSNVASNVMGMAQDNAGQLLALTISGEVYRIDPIARTSSLLMDLGDSISGVFQFRSLAFEPDLQEIWFTTEEGTTGTKRSLYKMSHDGTSLSLVATGNNLLNVAIGGRSDGVMGSAVYVSSPITAGGSNELFELRRIDSAEVPEPSSALIFAFLFGMAAAVGVLRKKRLRAWRCRSYAARAIRQGTAAP